MNTGIRDYVTEDRLQTIDKSYLKSLAKSTTGDSVMNEEELNNSGSGAQSHERGIPE